MTIQTSSAVSLPKWLLLYKHVCLGAHGRMPLSLYLALHGLKPMTVIERTAIFAGVVACSVAGAYALLARRSTETRYAAATVEPLEKMIRERVRYYRDHGINTIIHGVWGNGCTMYRSDVMQQTFPNSMRFKTASSSLINIGCFLRLGLFEPFIRQ